MIQCPSCGAQNPDYARDCEYCATDLSRPELTGEAGQGTWERLLPRGALRGERRVGHVAFGKEQADRCYDEAQTYGQEHHEAPPLEHDAGDLEQSRFIGMLRAGRWAGPPSAA